MDHNPLDGGDHPPRADIRNVVGGPWKHHHEWSGRGDNSKISLNQTWCWMPIKSSKSENWKTTDRKAVYSALKNVMPKRYHVRSLRAIFPALHSATWVVKVASPLCIWWVMETTELDARLSGCNEEPEINATSSGSSAVMSEKWSSLTTAPAFWLWIVRNRNSVSRIRPPSYS